MILKKISQNLLAFYSNVPFIFHDQQDLSWYGKTLWKYRTILQYCVKLLQWFSRTWNSSILYWAVQDSITISQLWSLTWCL